MPPPWRGNSQIGSVENLGRACANGLVVAAHDISDGGLAVAASEMIFGSAVGVEIDIDSLRTPYMDDRDECGAPSDESALFAETIGSFLVEVRDENAANFERTVGSYVLRLGTVTESRRLIIRNGATSLIDEDPDELHRIWSTALKVF